MKEVNLKNLLTSECMNLNYGTTKQKPKTQSSKNGGIYQNL